MFGTQVKAFVGAAVTGRGFAPIACALSMTVALGFAGAASATTPVFIADTTDATGSPVYGFAVVHNQDISTLVSISNPDLPVADQYYGLDLAPQTITIGGSTPTNLLAWCLNPFAPLDLTDGDYNVIGRNYLRTDGLNGQVGQLMNYGATHAADYAATQVAIWQVVTSNQYDFYQISDIDDWQNNGVTVTNSHIVDTTAIFTAAASQPTTYARLDDVQSISQPLGLSVLAVPEPQAWALMMIGFFSLGGTLRLARRSRAVAA